ncbi:uncharacterized protein N7511_002311 [Penicillium nucicola]|uniref:uncharacterized protein n=1 Tax=Penicillium nucicola TaxID=1850975 RepID=UPI002545591C|nr:uncharacterized protein N7511_002311 [Penicillium nucicola]KAJ5770260.1 hypothetical protein N7511_002311 [Penicillium nucicola]
MASPSESMFSWQYNSTNQGLETNLQFCENVPRPEIPSRGIGSIVKVLAVSLNPQDYKVPEMTLVGKMATRPPATPASDFVGRIYETNVPGLKIDDVVCGTLGLPQKHGSLAEYILVMGTDGIVKVPKEFVDEDDCALKLQQLSCMGIAALTALQTLDGVTEGNRVFINGGSGGTGTFAIQIAKHGLGCAEVTASCSPTNVTYLKELGADTLIDYTTRDVTLALREHVNQTGEKFDRIVDLVGNNMQMYWQSHHFLKENGKYVLVGTGTIGELTWNLLKIFLLPKFLGGGQREFSMMAVKVRKLDMEKLGTWVLENKVIPAVDRVFSIHDVPKAFKELKTGKRRGKLVVQVADAASISIGR